MTDHDDDLQASLRAHSDRANAAQRDRQDAAEKAKVQMESCRNVLSATVHPLLEEYAETMNAAGHQATVKQGGAGPLSASLTIRLSKRQNVSVLGFTCESTGKMTMSSAVDLRVSKAQVKKLPHPLSPELARRLVKDWLKEVLDTH